MSRLLDELCVLIEETANVVVTQILNRRSPIWAMSFITKYCVLFIINLVTFLRMQMPENIKVLRQIGTISVDRSLRHVKPN